MHLLRLAFVRMRCGARSCETIFLVHKVDRDQILESVIPIAFESSLLLPETEAPACRNNQKNSISSPHLCVRRRHFLEQQLQRIEPTELTKLFQSPSKDGLGGNIVWAIVETLCTCGIVADTVDTFHLRRAEFHEGDVGAHPGGAVSRRKD